LCPKNAAFLDAFGTASGGRDWAAHLLHCCIIRADCNELCKLVSGKGMESGMKLHGSLLSMLQRGFVPS
jgi:hypothetical protein